MLVTESRNRTNMIGQFFFGWSTFFFKKIATENLLLLSGLQIPLARFALVLHPRIVRLFAHFLLSRLLSFFYAIFSVTCVFVRCFSLFFCVWNRRISAAFFFVILFLHLLTCCDIRLAHFLVCLLACFFAFYYCICICVLADIFCSDFMLFLIVFSR